MINLLNNVMRLRLGSENYLTLDFFKISIVNLGNYFELKLRLDE